MLANAQTIQPGTFTKILKQLNPRLRVCCFENSKRLAGLYVITKTDEWEDICGVDKSVVPAYATFDNGGHILVSGWRRVFWILLTHNYTDAASIRKVCPGFFDSRARRADKFTGGVQGDPIDNKLLRYAASATDAVKNEKGEWVEVLTTDQMLDVATDIRAKDSTFQKEEREHDKWFLETWKKNGGGRTDRPNY